MKTELWNAKEFREQIRAGELSFPPLRICFPAASAHFATEDVIEAQWRGRTTQFAFVRKMDSTPKALDIAIAQAQRAAQNDELNPLVIVPYLSEGALRLLEAEQVSGIDLSGNGVVVTPEMAVWRSGQPNRFKTSQPIRNVYRGVSSLVAQSFLLRAEFASLVELQTFAQERLARQEGGETQGRLTKGTVSKVVQALDEEKIVLREQGKLRLLSPRLLMDRLQANYQKPSGRRVQGKTLLSAPEVWGQLRKSGRSAVTTGLGSAGRYHALSGPDALSLYVKDMDATREFLDIKTTSVFPNIELIEYKGDVVYFDAREEKRSSLRFSCSDVARAISRRPQRARSRAGSGRQFTARGRREATMIDPLFPHLLDIVSDPISRDLILAGGFGIRLKQNHLRETNAKTLMRFPEARATQDMDFFLSLSLFVEKERGAAVRALLDRLGYTEHTPKYQFGKPFDTSQPDIVVKVDLLARTPEGEDVTVKFPRVGHGSGIDLHGRVTPEGFAVESHFQELAVRGERSDGTEVEAIVRVPHPYAWLNLKVKAAHDWLLMDQGKIKSKPSREKHVFDVYALIAMLTEKELEEATQIATEYKDHAVAKDARQCARELFGISDAPGVDEIRRQAAQEINYRQFWQALSDALGLDT